jgi:hypothetical protein
VANDGLWVKYEQGTVKQWRALQQAHICEFNTWIMINIDHPSHLGDHCFEVIDIESKALVGNDLLKIVRPAARHFSCSIPTAVVAYNKRLQTHMTRHQILLQLHDLYQK